MVAVLCTATASPVYTASTDNTLALPTDAFRRLFHSAQGIKSARTRPSASTSTCP